MDVHLHMAILFLPILLISFITNLKYLAVASALANVFMAFGIGVVFYYALQDIPHPSERAYVGELYNWPLYFGTAIFSFEGIALVNIHLVISFNYQFNFYFQVLPLKNSMKKSKNFDRPAGVLNVGMIIITTLLIFFGFFGYLKWGDNTAGSLTLNLPDDM